MTDKKNQSLKEEEIEEKNESGKILKFPTSKLISIINENYLNTNVSFEEIDYEKIGKKYSIPKCICKKTKIIFSSLCRNIYYDNTKLLAKPKIIDFIDLQENSHIYEIYNFKFINKLINRLGFKNPVLYIEEKEYPISSLEHKFYSWISKFKIIDKNVIDYEDIFKSQNNIDIKKGSDLTSNFKYYFKYPSPDEEFLYIISDYRDEIFSNNLQEKITGLCGPMGIGKSTTLLALLKSEKNYCYFNIKALKDNEENIFIWKDKLLLLEVANAMKKNYQIKQFNDLKDKIKDATFFWDAIVTLIDNFIKSEIQIILILDQYKEKLDSNYYYIKKINELLKKDSKNFVNVIISSSINDKDVRNSLLHNWLKEKKNNLFDYKYYHSLIDIKNYIENDNTLSSMKKNMIIKDFNSIPKFYYAIKALEENELEKFRTLQIKKINTSIKEFFSESENFVGEMEKLINLRGSFGKSLNKAQFKELVKILPFKYFSFDLEKNIIDFSFSLVKDIFDDFLSDIVCKFLKSPVSSLKEGTIGDILELNLVTDLKNNFFCKFNEVIKVDCIWNLNKVETIIKSENSKSILLLQDNPEAKYIDFAILSNEKNLLLYQCKKALKKMPDSFITRKIIEYNKMSLMEKFKSHLNISIEKIYLFYVTGITFYKKDNKIMHRTWGVNENENFFNNIQIAEKAEAELFYYDVINRKIYLENKNDSKFEPIDDIIFHAEKYSSPIIIKPNENIYIKDEINQLELKEIEALRKKINKIDRNFQDEFFSPIQKGYLKDNHSDILNNKIIGCIKNPKRRDLIFQSMIGLKRGTKNYLLIEKVNKEKCPKINKKNKKGEKSKTTKNKMEIELEKQEEENNISLFLLKDDVLEEVENIKKDFYDNIEYAYIFEKNIVLKDV